MFTFIWYQLLYKPLYNLLILFYSASPGPDLGLAVIFLAFFIRIALLPLSFRGARSEYRLTQLEPVIEVIKKRYRYDLEKQRSAIKELLQDNKVNVFSNFFSIVFQIFFLVILYKIFASGLQLVGHNQLYDFMPDPGVIDPYFLEKINLIVPNNTASLFVAFMVFFHQAIQRVKKKADATSLEKAMLFVLPLVTYFATLLLPSAKAIFIAASVLFSLLVRGIKTIIIRLFVKDENLKANINSYIGGE
ncbi:MAG: hypothetical protein A2233_03845 [Candidatus Kerfeldbacteria bacterium RIFOXYA2_FULL_38_24]|uniref:Membrane insertase YidC/Oxa/ALB C-terminal domain-containing protein n=1 Tax=Candidatus Kerfeldbacteria bacterium RIFOXYB2_FULL_38_14 TaxID=1798547 RepID=A0A1G2BFZ7_9BACT|nr:MAG: hypothetical protein A2233_03845 [Candidatus Kerfeldbacteria bacterium RIFOXYA2_FULL_38_24]OGY87200.1 MAG: hypothetical protein A2319_00965 [Candidatus Kerfeldbacteria bacterium RIFOXYB2_FULL_38_14]OGY88468.1 MAG: hypothetical protein A2458_01665 [Candidatus Kerfeldbacteria bacterium RIFOXYC2_FULL_38_9]